MLLVWMLDWFITPSLRWQTNGFLMIYWPSLLPLKTYLKTPPQCSLTTEFWYVIFTVSNSEIIEIIVTGFKFIYAEICYFLIFFFLLQAVASLTAVTGLYLFSRRMVLPRRTKIAIGVLAAMAYTQVYFQTEMYETQ